jgi:DNA-binding transcriptional ArsR family regulator
MHFTAEDLTRVRLATEADLLWELLLSAHLLGKPDGAVVFGAWKQGTRARLGPGMRMLFDLAPPWGYSADFLTPTAGTGDLEVGLDAIRSTSRARLRADIASLDGPVQPWRAGLATADPDALAHLDTTLRAYHRAALAPRWPRIQAQVRGDHARRVRAVARGGTELLLGTLHPTVTWEPPVLTVASGYDRDIHLDGRGILLVPSFFCWLRPITLRAPDRRPVLVYPIDHDIGWYAERPGASSPALSALVGRTRAVVLETIAASVACSTTELARRVGISPAGASQHAAVLREAGVIATYRDGKESLHTTTRLGIELLEGRWRRAGAV